MISWFSLRFGNGQFYSSFFFFIIFAASKASLKVHKSHACTRNPQYDCNEKNCWNTLYLEYIVNEIIDNDWNVSSTHEMSVIKRTPDSIIYIFNKQFDGLLNISLPHVKMIQTIQASVVYNNNFK